MLGAPPKPISSSSSVAHAVLTSWENCSAGILARGSSRSAEDSPARARAGPGPPAPFRAEQHGPDVMGTDRRVHGS
ncbi:hypothetical protein O1L60_05915 [Streptomyces diastatochromogenes]|nr:hypothetical protein [Streptomyces diastatochromogenes]